MARRKPTSDQVAWLETAEFEAVMREYAEESGKEFAEACNLKMRDACLKAAAATPKAGREAIRARVTPRYVAARLRKKPKQIVTVKIMKTVGFTKSGRPKRKAFYRTYARRYSRREAKLYARALIGRRTRSIGFIRGFFIALARKIEETSGIPGSGGPMFRGIVADFQQASPDSPTATGESHYKYSKSRRLKTVPEDILRQSWAVGLGQTILDAQQYIARKMRERAAKYSSVGKLFR